MAQIATVGALNPLAAEGAGVVEAEAVAEEEEEEEEALLVWETEVEDEGRTEELTVVDEAAEETLLVETAVAMEETNDWETTSPVVPVMVKPLE